MRPFLALFILSLAGSTLGQVNIRQQQTDSTSVPGPSQDSKEDEKKTEIYTSMHELVAFFEKEKEYVEDMEQIMAKKLVSVDAQGSIGAYIASYEDALGEQDDDESFLFNPLNVYNLIR